MRVTSIPSAFVFGMLACTPSEESDLLLSGGGGVSVTATGGTAGRDEGDSAATGTGAVEGGSGAGGGSTTTDGSTDAGLGTGGDATSNASSSSEGASTQASTGELGESSTGEPFDGVIDIGILAHNDCTFTVDPASITVLEGTAFSVNWVSANASEVEFDVAKIDPFNQVPILLGMEPGDAYHDEVHDWCGNLFNGTFDFRLTSCADPTYIPVDCGG